MPRKFVKRSTKRKTQRQSTAGTVNTAKMEKDFLKTPAKLAAQLSKEIKAHKQKEKKIKGAINKIKSQVKTTETRLKNASKNTTSATGKKQYSTAKKSYATAQKTQTQLSKELEQASSNITTLTGKHARLVALGKHISQFDKEWENSAKTEKTAKTNKTTAKVKTAKPKTQASQKRNTLLDDDNSFNKDINKNTQTTETEIDVEETSDLTS